MRTRSAAAATARRRVLRAGTIALVMLSLPIGCSPRRDAGSEQPPNFVLLFSDDAGYADFGFQGSGSHATPNIDAIARDGIRFAQAYVSASVCSPSRAGLLTGRYQQRFGHEYNLPGMEDSAVPNSVRGLPLQERTLADLLRERGYATGLVGKWHLGLEPQFHPQRRGFDEFFGMTMGSGPYLPGTNERMFDGDVPVPAAQLPYLTDALGDRAVDFIERHRDEPFFLFLSFNAPHTPLEGRPEDVDEALARFETHERAVNVAMTRALDDNIGKVLAALDRLQLADDTLVIFTNDNGGAMPYNASLNAPLRGTKGTFLEGGIRVPMAMRWPGRLQAGREFEAPVSTLDFLPTMLSAAGGRLPVDRSFDGVDLLPHLTDATRGRPHPILYWRIDAGAAVRRDDWKLVRTPDLQHWLFDLSTDISETTDLSAEHPEIADELRELLERWESTLAPPVWRTGPQWQDHSLIRYDQATVDSFIRH